VHSNEPLSPLYGSRTISLHRNAELQPSRRQSRAYSSFYDEQQIQKISNAAANLFPLWLIIAALAAFARPQLFLWFQKDFVTMGLAITMLSMGTSLTLEVLSSFATKSLHGFHAFAISIVLAVVSMV